MRYYNENPQVVHWMSKCDTLQQELDMVRDELITMNYRAEKYYYRWDKLMKKVTAFNSLPWYKKMFYKFDV